MSAIQQSLELIESTITHVVCFPYHVYCFGKKEWGRRREKERDEVERSEEGEGEGYADGDTDDLGGESLERRVLIEK